MSTNQIKVAELFAGVGGFRLGLELSSKEGFNTVFANQWEPGIKRQDAYDCYIRHFGESPCHSNEDIAIAKNMVPPHDLLVGGFPCQDYSVANSRAKGIEGKKGVLWWEIRSIVERHRPPYILLENVNRLISSPTNMQRGRDLGIILRSLHDLGYAVEWRVINAADYGCAQRRRRIFLFAFHSNTPFYRELIQCYSGGMSGLEQWLTKSGFFAPAFPVKGEWDKHRRIVTSIGEDCYPSLSAVSDCFTACFQDSGIMMDGEVLSIQTKPVAVPPITLGEIISTAPVDERYFISDENLAKWYYVKGAKDELRLKKNGSAYRYTEGALPFPDNPDCPARTIITNEGKINRSSHVVIDYHSGRLRTLTPEECELLNGFPPRWTEGIPQSARYKMMGNALVVDLIKKMGDRLLEIL